MKAITKSLLSFTVSAALAAAAGCNGSAGSGSSAGTPGEVGDQRQGAEPSVRAETSTTEAQTTPPPTTSAPIPTVPVEPTPAPIPAPTETPTPVASETPVPTPSPTPTASPSPSLGQSCVSSDPNHQCIGLKIVSYKDSAGAIVLPLDKAKTLIEEINALWQVCDIAFQIEEYTSADPTQYGLQYGAGSATETTSIRQAFSNNTTFLYAATGPWNTSTIAWTQMPGGAPYGVVVDADFSDQPVTVGHELGHYMGLDHDSAMGNIMYYIVYATDTTITTSQCSIARSTNLNYWQAMMRK
ncbi:hypothetical protein WDW86_19890 [Bdellovibrionota bacterium FG-2]